MPTGEESLRQAREDAADLSLAEERLSRWDGDTSTLRSFDEVMDELGITQEEVDAMPEVEFE